ncbi:MAG: phosphoenolpyruvate--protein phosphotransferase, partial [Halieaceae bacterium]|nr:phosphoenolpyruvate--protein phosphotransferase [Halieaceae bacterium]
MVELQGIPVSPGVAIGPALVLDADGYRISRTLIAADQAGEEYARLRLAVDAVAKQIEANRLETSAVAGDETGDIFSAQMQMLNDPRLHGELRRRITTDHHAAGYAVNRVLRNYALALRRLENPMLAERAEDVLDIEKQLLLHLGAVTEQPL